MAANFKISCSRVLILMLLCILLRREVSAEDVQSLNGNDWSLSSVGYNGTVAAKVPGGVYTDLMAAGEIGDPYYRFNDVAYRWVAMRNWSYSKTFQLSKTLLTRSRINLVCDGLDTVANISINGHFVGNASNMFRRYIFNIKQYLIMDGSNVIRVDFQSPVTYSANQASLYSYDVPPDCPPSEQNGDCHFNFIRKEASSFSWDWGPSFPSMGIWKDIYLEGYNETVIRYVTYETHFVIGDWMLNVTVFFDLATSQSGATNEEVSSDMLLTGALYLSIPKLKVVLRRPMAVSRDAPYAKIGIRLNSTSGVKAWWPNGHGEQTLYLVSIEFSRLDASDTLQRDIFVGFRTVELVQDFVDADPPGYTFYFKINDVPMFMKGSNWIPADSFQERITLEHIDRLLRSAVEANMNMLRVWGGGVYESEEFYRLADQYGILIWQDFMFACALYPTDQEFINNVREEVIHQVRRLKNHPSIVIWSGNNENEGALANNWYNINASDYKRYYLDYVLLYVDTVRAIVLQEDDTRPFVTSSPSNGLDTITEGWVAKDPQSTRYGDTHFYDYNFDSWNWSLVPVPRFASEFGLQSWSSVETLLDVSLPADLDMNSDFVRHRQHHPDGNAQMLNETSIHLSLPNSVNATLRFIDFIYFTQINQAMGMKSEVELYRRSQNELVASRGLTMGALFWQLNDIWQAPTWASIEYGGTWKMLHYFAKMFFSPSIISPYLDGDNLRVYYINDNHNKSVSTHRDTTPKLRKSRFHDRFVHRMSMGEREKDSFSIDREVNAETLVNLEIACYKWSNMTAQYTWNNAFNVSSQFASRSVFVSPLATMLQQCRCTSVAECFLHFTGSDSNKVDAFPHSFLLLTSPSAVVGLQKPNIQIARIQLVDKLTVQIDIASNQIAPFVWLTAPGFKGRFSENGFLLVYQKTTVFYTSWLPVDDVDRFARTLQIKSLMDVYEKM